ncbi:MAG TPA: glycoside hydrolase family 11 protein [Polyangiaceae bacterium]|nr:glycoside hydrolase family 11 protein [Polyangiaceae bacterium]
MLTAPAHLSVLTITMALAVAGCGSSDAPADGAPGHAAGSSNTAHGGAPTTGGQSGGGQSAGGGATGAGGAFGNAGGLGAGGAGLGSGGHGGAIGFGGMSAGGTHAGGAGGAHAGGANAGGPNAGGAGTAGSAGDVDCSTPMPTGGMTYSGTNVNGSADGLGYGIWTNGSGGSITVFKNAHAFSASWNNSQDFLAHVGLDFNSSKAYTAYGTILAQYVEKKSGTAGGFSSIGIYGWTHSPCVEWYINEDAFNGLGQRGNVTATIDGGTYALTMMTTTGTGGANACESGHSGGWTQMISTRKTARQCGTVTVSDHFAAWAKQGWSLGTLSSVHINVEVGGGQGSIDFPVANVTTSSK